MRRSQTGEPSELDLMAIACLLPSLLYVLVMFVYPFLYGVYLSLHPLKVDGFSLTNYIAFFTDQYQYKTVGITFRLAVPNTVVVVAFSFWTHMSSPTPVSCHSCSIVCCCSSMVRRIA